MKNTLKLLFIDDNQKKAESIVELLSMYYEKVSLGFLDDREELEKQLRRKWDVVVYGKGYDLTLVDVRTIIKQTGIDLPLIALSADSLNNSHLNAEGLPVQIDTGFIQAINPKNKTELMLSIILQHQALMSRNKVEDLRDIIGEAEQRANVLIKNSKSAVAYIDEGIHVFSNQPYLELFGFSSIEELMGMPVIDLISGGENIKEFKQFLSKFIKGNRDNVEFKFESKRKNGKTFAAKLQLAVATYEGNRVVQVIIQRNESGINAEEIAKKLAEVERKDSLTGLENRKGLQKSLPKFFEIAKSGQAVLGLMYVRIDNLANINESLGIEAVDITVKQVAIYLKSVLDCDYICRYSDGVYVAVINDATTDKLNVLAKKAIDEIEGLVIEFGQRSVTTSVSIGMSMINKQSISADIAMQHAGSAHTQAMDKTKNEGGGFHIYDASEFASSDDDALAEYMANAVNNNNFILVYQPIYDIQNDSSDKFEVGIRLKLSDGNIMMPKDFYDVAKNNNLLLQIERWMLVSACKQLKQVRTKNPTASVIVRLSSEMLVDEQLPEFVGKMIAALGNDSSALTLQFPEQILIDYMAAAKKLFSSLAQLNSPTSISDFGSTEKSIEISSYLNPNIVRLDRDYIKDLSTEASITRIKNLIASTSEQNISTLMPFIEDAATMSVSWGVGARYLQGNYLQEPTSEMTFG